MVNGQDLNHFSIDIGKCRQALNENGEFSSFSFLLSAQISDYSDWNTLIAASVKHRLLMGSSSLNGSTEFFYGSLYYDITYVDFLQHPAEKGQEKYVQFSKNVYLAKTAALL